MVNSFKAYLSTALTSGGSETEIFLDRITTLTGETIATGDFATFGRGVLTINPEGDGESSFVEYASFTAVDSSEPSVTGVTRGLSAKGDTGSTSRAKFFPVGTPVIISVGFHNINDLKSYIDDAVAAAAFGTSNVAAGTAGETLVAGNLVYLKNDGKWWKTDADTSTTVDGVQLGIAQGAGTADAAITGGVLLKGVDTHQTSLSAGTTYYASNTAGGISSSAGTTERAVGVAKSSTDLYFDSDFKRVLTATEKTDLTNISVAGIISMYGGATAPSGWLLCDGSAVSRTTYADLFTAISTSYGIGDNSTTFNLPNLKGRFPLGYSASAPTKVLTFASRSSDTITVTGSDNHAHNEVQTGQAALYSAPSGAMTGLTDNTTYYLIRVAYNQFNLASSVANANAGTAISLSSDGTGAQTFTITYTARPLGQAGGEETHAITDAEMPSHLHVIPTYGGAGSVGISGGNDGAGSGGDENTNTSGSDTVHNNMPLFTVVNYIIKT